MNRASSAVFHFWSKFSPPHPVDAMWIKWKRQPEQDFPSQLAQPTSVQDAAFVHPVELISRQRRNSASNFHFSAVPAVTTGFICF
jgi:hypothetical protein